MLDRRPPLELRCVVLTLACAVAMCGCSRPSREEVQQSERQREQQKQEEQQRLAEAEKLIAERAGTYQVRLNRDEIAGNTLSMFKSGGYWLGGVTITVDLLASGRAQYRADFDGGFFGPTPEPFLSVGKWGTDGRFVDSDVTTPYLGYIFQSPYKTYPVPVMRMRRKVSSFEPSGDLVIENPFGHATEEETVEVHGTCKIAPYTHEGAACSECVRPNGFSTNVTYYYSPELIRLQKVR